MGENAWSPRRLVAGPAGNPYLGAVLTTLDPGTAYQKQSKTEQSVDLRGNVTQVKQYDYGLTSWRTYNHTYLTGSEYAAKYIFNRLLSTTLVAGSQSVTLVTNTYDGGGGPKVGNVTRRVAPGSATNFTYGAYGTVATASDDHGHTVSINYSNNYAAPSAITPNNNSSLGETMSWDGLLNLTSATGPNSSMVSFAYDASSRPTSSTSPDGAVTTYEYNNSPPWKKATTNGRWVKTTLDGLGRTVKVEQGDST